MVHVRAVASTGTIHAEQRAHVNIHRMIRIQCHHTAQAAHRPGASEARQQHSANMTQGHLQNAAEMMRARATGAEQRRMQQRSAAVQLQTVLISRAVAWPQVHMKTSVVNITSAMLAHGR